jgi:hypothetical protein
MLVFPEFSKVIEICMDAYDDLLALIISQDKNL